MTQSDPKSSSPSVKAEQANRELDATKSAISNDLKQLGQHLSPEHLREEAKQLVDEAKQGARDLVQEAKDNVSKSITEAKDHAVESLSNAADTVGRGARQVGGFVAENAVPLTLIGLGAGWLYYSTRQRTQVSSDMDWESDATYKTKRFVRDGRDKVEGAWHRAEDVASGLKHKAGDMASDLKERAGQTADMVGQKASDLSRNMKTQIDHASERSKRFAHDEPLIVAAAAVVAGMGLAALIPSTDMEARTLGPTRDRLFRQVKDTVRTSTEAAGEAFDAVKRNVQQTTSGI
jgi:ElaB/YqjD/DUF883 family membrane-anchored ribosome-binding protein